MRNKEALTLIRVYDPKIADVIITMWSKATMYIIAEKIATTRIVISLADLVSIELERKA